MSNLDFTFRDKLRGFDLTFKTTYDLFSYKKIDNGTRLLVATLDIPTGSTNLDLGCGYGVIGVVMAKLNPSGKVFLVDRDLVAVEFTKANCLLNKVANCEIKLSDGFSCLEGTRFDVIAANLPTHIAKESLEKILTDANSHLNKNGAFYAVCTNQLKPYILRQLLLAFPIIKTIKRNRDYSILKTG